LALHFLSFLQVCVGGIRLIVFLLIRLHFILSDAFYVLNPHEAVVGNEAKVGSCMVLTHVLNITLFTVVFIYSLKNHSLFILSLIVIFHFFIASLSDLHSFLHFIYSFIVRCFMYFISF